MQSIMPFPSAGCQTCKIRRIKCDETQPVCRRCMKSQRICYGMRAGQSCSVVHSENSFASGQRKRPRGPRSTTIGGLINNLDAISQDPLVDLKRRAIAYYLHYHLQTLKDTPDILKGVSYDFLPTQMSRADCPILELAVSSMALAVFSRAQQHSQAAIEACMTYHRLLQAVQAAIISLDEGNIDAYLLAIFFMGRYEGVVHRPSHFTLKTPFSTTMQSFSHHDGALAILKIWKTQPSHSQPATDVIMRTRRCMIKSALLRNLALPEWMLEGTYFGEHGLELDYDCIVVRIVNVRQRLSTLVKEKAGIQRRSQDLMEIAEELNKEARDIDEALQDWACHFPSTWGYQRHTLSNFHLQLTRDFYSPIVYSYSSPTYAAVWNLYYATRMLINSTRLKILKLIRSSSDYIACEQRLDCLSRMKIAANDLVSSLPFCLERFKVTDSPDASSPNPIKLNTNDIKPYVASLAIWPLTIASGLADDVEQKLWFRSELARLGRIVGDRGLECAETDQWLEL